MVIISNPTHINGVQFISQGFDVAFGDEDFQFYGSKVVHMPKSK